MNPAELANLLETLAQAVRLVPTLQGQPALQAVAAMAQPQAPQRTVGDWLTQYEQIINERGYKSQTMKNRKANMAHVRRIWGAVPIAALKPHGITQALKQFLPARSHTAQRVLAELRDVYVEAIANGEAESNPAALVKMPTHKIKRARLTLKTWQAMRVLSQTGPQRWVESMLLLALATGQRRGDLAKMSFDDIVTDEAGAKYLRVEQQKEAGKGYGARLEIPLALRLDVIGMTVGDVIEHCRNSAKPGPRLLRKAGGGPIEESSLSARFAEHIRAVLGENAHQAHEWPSLHEVRSLSARCYIEQGLPMQTVQTLLGHKALEMTQMYADDRGLSAKHWKRVEVARQTATQG